MDRAVRLASFWNWLPAFRVVAETEHLPTAARLLHVSPSALSRTVKQLEDALGFALFERAGRRLRLAPEGRIVLAAVRDTMRGLDDQLSTLGAGPVRETRIRVAAQAPWLALVVVPALASAELAIDHVEADLAWASGLLLRGELDLIVGTSPSADDRLLIVEVAALAMVVACAPSHPLARGAPSSLATAEFAVCSDGPDPWPPDVPRRVSLSTRRLEVVLDACTTGRHVAVVPAILARFRGLHTLPSPRLAAARLYVVRRRPLAAGWLDAVAARVRDHAADVLVSGGGSRPARPPR